jgi:O-antigen/teichoic acid export membrane protein
MSSIRRQSIISSIVIYFGFAIGLLNVYFFTKEGLFTEAEYGLTTIFLAIAVMMTSIASLAMPSYIYKFYPYYKDNLPIKRNDMLTWALFVGVIGFLLVMVAGLLLKNLVIQKYGTNSHLLVVYYYWIFPFGLGLTVYSILEAYTWSIGKPVVTNYFREVQWRLLITVLIILFLTNTIKNFDQFIKLYAFTYPGIAIGLFAYLLLTKKIHLTLKFSKVSRRFLKKILLFCSFFYGATIISTLSKVFDSFVIASVLEDGLDKAGVFGLATIITSIIQAPQRGIISASMSHLSRAWKEKNIELLQKVYQRSSINQLIFACAIFLLIWMNFTDSIGTFGLKKVYLDAAPVFFILGLSVIIDMGTGVNSQIIVTSTFWKFELISGVILLTIMLPLTYLLTKNYGIIGPAYATLIAMSIYNTIRIVFLWKKYKLFPFTVQSLYTILLAAVCYGICFFLFSEMHGIAGMFVRSISFILLYVPGVLYLNLSPDINPVLQTIKKRIGKN